MQPRESSLHALECEGNSASLSTMQISRRVTGKRRIGLPEEMASLSGIGPNSWLRVALASDRRWALELIPVPQPDDPVSAGLRDPDRPRMVTEVLQVTLPKALMDQVGMKPDDWVFISSVGASRGMRVIPQSKVTLRETRVQRSDPSRRSRAVAAGGS
jgi:bifunctional DNA-binding transcriptional regulator/antitoxin component of YhaV-PrlF toxin-antitoxin module